MKIATIDGIYDVIYKGQMIGSREYILNYRPVVGFDITDQIAMENIAIEIIDAFNKD